MMAVSVVSAKEDSPVSHSVNVNYVNNLVSTLTSASNGNNIIQGETYTKKLVIGKKIKSLTIECAWMSSKNSLLLTVISPNGIKYGPYSDSYDGKIDAHTGVKITRSTGKWDATAWTIKVYGKQISGTESTTIYGTWVE